MLYIVLRRVESGPTIRDHRLGYGYSVVGVLSVRIGTSQARQRCVGGIPHFLIGAGVRGQAWLYAPVCPGTKCHRLVSSIEALNQLIQL